MKITAIEISNLRGFEGKNEISFSDSINLFVGNNNSGKSTLLKAIYVLQNSAIFNRSDITLGEEKGYVKYWFTGEHYEINKAEDFESFIRYDIASNQLKLYKQAGITPSGINFIPSSEPRNLIYPFLSMRKTNNFSESVTSQTLSAVSGNFENIYSKIDKIIPLHKEDYEKFSNACQEILGFNIGTKSSDKGKVAVYFGNKEHSIELNRMGDGVPGILYLIIDILFAKDRIFIIEEPENDIHPLALKKLLLFLMREIKSNQFFISTHSHIVVNYLSGFEGSKLFELTSEIIQKNGLDCFRSSVFEVPENLQAKQLIFEKLGYDLADFNLAKGWLILEESSAESMIRDYFIDWFVPKLKGALKTIASNGIENIDLKFHDLNRLFLFLHLEPIYKNKVWVIIDNGEREKEIIDKLFKLYANSGWNHSNFANFRFESFEHYYPSKFHIEVEEISKIHDKNDKRIKKKLLLDNVKLWIDKYPEEAKREFENSAAEVIECLKSIEASLL